jgi:hypothetical protein
LLNLSVVETPELKKRVKRGQRSEVRGQEDARDQTLTSGALISDFSHAFLKTMGAEKDQAGGGDQPGRDGG